MSPLFEVDMLSLMIALMCVLKRIASGAVVKSPSKEFSQFSEAKTPMSSLFWDKNAEWRAKSGANRREICKYRPYSNENHR